MFVVYEYLMLWLASEGRTTDLDPFLSGFIAVIVFLAAGFRFLRRTEEKGMDLYDMVFLTLIVLAAAGAAFGFLLWRSAS